jgi:hypothetical protein
MLTRFKLFEKLGIDDTVVQITEKIWVNFLKKYDKNKTFTSEDDSFYTDVSEYDIGYKKFEIMIKYDSSESQCGFPMKIGAVSRKDNTIPKSLNELKEDIIHEVQHLIYTLRKNGKLKNIKSFSSPKKGFLKISSNSCANEIVRSFSDKEGNIYGQKISLINFLKYDKFSDKFKKLLSYIYLSDENELSSKLHEFFIKVKNSEEIKNEYFNIFKDMKTFDMKVDDFTKNELFKISTMFNLKDMKKVKKYINMKGDKLIRKINKLSYFKDPNSEL